MLKVYIAGTDFKESNTMRFLFVTVFVLMATKLTVEALLNLPPINPDNLDTDGPHVCQTTEQESYTQSASFRHYITEQSTTWCLAFPPRCTIYRIASRTSYRTETRIGTRVKYFCCEGYEAMPNHTYCVSKCENNCNSDKSQGFCLTSGKCMCHPGYQGSSCELAGIMCQTCAPSPVFDQPADSIGYFRVTDNQELCENLSPIPDFKECSGLCGSRSSFSHVMSGFTNSCYSCQSSQTEIKNITLTCDSGRNITKTYSAPTACSCSACTGGK